MPLRVFTLRERPELRPAILSESVGASMWPEYMLQDPVARLYFSPPFLDRYLDFVLIGVGDGNEVVARGFSVPFAFNFPDREELPDGGWDEVIRWAHEDLQIDRKPTAVSALEISLLPRHLNRRVVFDGISLDEHGVTAAAIHLLLRAFRWKEGQRVLSWEEMSVWELLDRRSPEEDNRDLWVIAHWQDWNEAGILWDDRFYRAWSDGVFPPGRTFDAFKKRYERMLLVYRPRTEYDKFNFEFVLVFFFFTRCDVYKYIGGISFRSCQNLPPHRC